jgi:hypothetical protein
MIVIVVGLVIAAYAAISLTARGGVFNRDGSAAFEDKLPAEVMKLAETIPAKAAETLDALPPLPARAVRAVELLPSVLPPAPAPIRRSLDRLDARLPPSAKATSPAATRASARSGGGVSLLPARCSGLSVRPRPGPSGQSLDNRSESPREGETDGRRGATISTAGRSRAPPSPGSGASVLGRLASGGGRVLACV